MMTDDLAKRIANDFCGQTLDGWVIKRYRGHGATSVVLLGQNEKECVAVKIYSKELTQGADATQSMTELERINRQVSMKELTHPNLVRTRGAGRCPKTQYDYVIMDYIADPPLNEILQDVERDKIRHIIQQVARATLFLHETVEYVHRDIKPSNIALRLPGDYHVTLLDLGLVRPTTGDTATDQGVPKFLATKRYAPPEFLNGTMTRNPDGWLAVSFYQLGGILYNLIMRKRLFDDYNDEPLIHAILHDVPRLDAPDVPADLIQLGRDCLQKNAGLRLSLVTWDRFLYTPESNAATTQRDRLRDLVARLGAPRPLAAAFPEGALETHARESAIAALTRDIDYHLRALLSDVSVFPRPTIEVLTNNSSPILFRVSMAFPRASSPVEITLFLSCNLLALDSLVCDCDLTCTIGTPANPPANTETATIYHGSFVGGAFAQKLEEAIPEALATLLGSHLKDDGHGS